MKLKRLYYKILYGEAFLSEENSKRQCSEQRNIEMRHFAELSFYSTIPEYHVIRGYMYIRI